MRRLAGSGFLPRFLIRFPRPRWLPFGRYTTPVIAELPQGHFAHPVDSEGNLTGELQLKALIGVDGSVKKVTVLSGSPALAEAGMRAVRQWAHSPYQMHGNAVEVETQIKMNFFGQDAVSIRLSPAGQLPSASNALPQRFDPGHYRAATIQLRLPRLSPKNYGATGWNRYAYQQAAIL